MQMRGLGTLRLQMGFGDLEIKSSHPRASCYVTNCCMDLLRLCLNNSLT